IAVGVGAAVEVRDAGARKQPHSFRGMTAPVAAVAFSPDGKWLAAAGALTHIGNLQDPKSIPHVGEVKTWDAAAGKELWAWSAASSEVLTGLAYSPDGRRLAVCTSQRVSVKDVKGAE